MADRVQSGVKTGSVDLSWGIVLRKTADSTEHTGALAATMTLSYWRQGASRVGVTATDLATVTSAHSDGGVKEIDATNMPGTYRIDWPDAAWAAGADWVQLTVKVAGAFVYNEHVPLTSHVIQTGDSYARLGAPVGASLSADVASVQADTNDLQTRIPAALVSGRIDASVGAMAANTLNANALATDAVTELQVGLATSAALSTLSSYVDTEVAAILAAVDTEVAAIKAKTDQLSFTQALKVDAALNLASDITAVVCQKVADILMRRAAAQIEGSLEGDVLSSASLYGLLMRAENSNTVTNPGFMTIYESDGLTELAQIPLLTAPNAEDITGFG